jgi:hypothetical protein
VTTELMDYRVLGAIMLGACASLVSGGVKYVSRDCGEAPRGCGEATGEATGEYSKKFMKI